MLYTLILSSLLFYKSLGFYLPGVAPHEYEFAEDVKVKVNRLDSIMTQIPYDYYKLPFCRPKADIVHDSESLGEVLSGDVIESSPYIVKMQEPQDCTILCRRTYKKKELHQFVSKIEKQYRVHLIVDNLPAAQKFKTIIKNGDKEKEDFIYEKGYLLGHVAHIDGEKTVLLNNHIDLILLTHSEDRYRGGRIVGFEVRPASIQHTISGEWDDKNVEQNSISCATDQNMKIKVGTISGPLSVIWSYGVKFEPSDVKWASRWDAYLKMQDPEIHWFSLLNSFLIVVFLSGMVAMILIRALHKDLRRYNADPDEMEAQLEETGWKLVHGDVFRPPEHCSLFATIVGTGVQVFAMALWTILFAALGVLSPASRGSLMTTLLILYVFMGALAGYYSARLYKTFGQTDWQKQTLQTAFLFPGINFVVFFILNLFVWHLGSSGAVPFGTMFSLLVLWFGISGPLVYLGAYFSYKKDSYKLPCRTNDICRSIPPQAWYLRKHFAILIGGILPFGAVFIEVFFIMSSVWLHHYYYMFGFLLLAFIILILTAGEITIVMAYFQLCAEDWQWWWRSILTAGSSALYLFLYSILYFYTKLNIVPLISTLLYFGYMFLVCLTFFIITGTIGFYSTFYFIRKIYDEIKVE